MKLKHILPIATVASIATIVTPLVTSCSSRWTMTYDWLEKGKYKSRIQPLSERGTTEAKAQQLYFDNLAKNKKLFFDDWAWSTLNDSYDNTSSVAKLSQFNVKYKNMGVDKTKHLLSFEIEFYAEGTLKSSQGRAVSNIEMLVNNLPYSLKYYENGQWCLETPLSNIKSLEEFKKIMSGIPNWGFKSYYYSENGSLPIEEGQMDLSPSKLPTEKMISMICTLCKIIQIDESNFMRHVFVS